MSQATGIYQPTISAIEKGTNVATVEQLALISAALGVPIQTLVPPVQLSARGARLLNLDPAIEELLAMPEAKAAKVGKGDIAALRKAVQSMEGVEPSGRVLYHLVMALRAQSK